MFPQYCVPTLSIQPVVHSGVPHVPTRYLLIDTECNVTNYTMYTKLLDFQLKKKLKIHFIDSY